MRPITVVAGPAAGPSTMVRLDEWADAPLGVQVSVQGTANYTVNHSFRRSERFNKSRTSWKHVLGYRTGPCRSHRRDSWHHLLHCYRPSLDAASHEQRVRYG